MVSRILVVIVSHFAARLFSSLFNNWAWLGSSLVYWGSMILTIWLFGDKQSMIRWFSKSQGSKCWIVLALAMGSISLPLLFFPNLHVMKPFGLAFGYTRVKTGSIYPAFILHSLFNLAGTL